MYLLTSPLPAFLAYLNIQLRMGVHVVDELLVVGVLRHNLLPVVVPEVISQRHQEDIGAEQLSLLLVLVQQELCSLFDVARGDGLRVHPPRTGHAKRQGW